MSNQAKGGRASASPWNLRSYYERTDHKYQRNPNNDIKAPLADDDSGPPSSCAKDLFMFSNGGDSKTRIGMIDGREVEFELQEDVNSRPTTSRDERQQRTCELLNAIGSPLEIRCRWWLMRYSLASITILYFAIFVALNFVFAGLWSIQDGKCCDNESLTYTQLFDFSIQTSTTIGYGENVNSKGFVPQGHFANFLVVMLSCCTLILNTVYAGLLFLKFVAPSARLEFSEVVTLSNVNGVPCLEFRIGNADGSWNLLKDVNARLTYSFDVDYTDEKGAPQHVMQTQELRLLHDKRMRLADFVWTLRHMIDEHSPLFGLDFREFPGKSIVHFEACVNATQEHTGASVFCQTVYMLEDVLIGHRFVDQMSWSEDKTSFKIDYANFSKTTPHPVWYPVNRNQHISFHPSSRN